MPLTRGMMPLARGTATTSGVWKTSLAVPSPFSMLCPKCELEQPDGSVECLRCGVVFARYEELQAAGGRLYRPVPAAVAIEEPGYHDRENVRLGRLAARAPAPRAQSFPADDKCSKR